MGRHQERPQMDCNSIPRHHSDRVAVLSWIIMLLPLYWYGAPRGYYGLPFIWKSRTLWLANRIMFVHSYLHFAIWLVACFLPQERTMVLFYPHVAQERDWYFQVITVDEYMLAGWLAPVMGIILHVLCKRAKWDSFSSSFYPYSLLTVARLR